ncbi:MAG: 5'-methylthioadenosine/S-adenosylhomocysteine nucleosidase [Scytonema sp. PMC 1070.18]|nr:5'-methylthioadenosine/S-adenosylhomocysteine nucleosidase [Scytonema sp. PMC 1070.18]
MIERAITIENLCNILKTDYIALLGQRKSGLNSLIGCLVNKKSYFTGMEFISVALPRNKDNTQHFMKSFLNQLIYESAQVSPKNSLEKEVQQVIKNCERYPEDYQLEEVLNTLGRRTTANYLVIVLHALSEVSENPLKSLLLLLRNYHDQINNSSQPGAKLRFLVAGNARLWKLCVDGSAEISPFNIAERVFLGGLHFDEINAHIKDIEEAVKLRDLTDGVPSLVENIINLPTFSTNFSDITVCFSFLQDNWNYLSVYAKEKLKNLINGTEKIPSYRSDSKCLQIPNSEYIDSVWVEAFWAGFLKMCCGELAWRSPIHQAFVMSQTIQINKFSKSDLIKTNLLERVERLDIAIKNTDNPELHDNFLEELLMMVVYADNSDIIPILKKLRNREDNNIVLATIKQVAANSSKRWIKELEDSLAQNQDIISKFVIITVMQVVKKNIVNTCSTTSRQNIEERRVINEFEKTEIIPINHGKSKEEEFEAWMKGQSWYSQEFPDYKTVSAKESELLKKEIEIVIITATDKELYAVGHLLKPYSSKSKRSKKILQISERQETYYLGKFGEYKTVLTQCEMGNKSSGAAPFATQAAIQLWYPKAIIMVGIAFGKTSIKQKIGDVLVASGIIDYESQRIGQEKTIYRAGMIRSNATLLNRFKNAKSWSFYRPDSSLCEMHYCSILSGDKLIDNFEFKENLFQEFPEAGGGEMEGVGLYASAERMNVPCILVKSICDWADGDKKDIYQKFAAASAVSLVHEVLSNKYALDSLKKSVFE